MKKLFRLVVVLVLLAGGAYVWFLQSVHYVLFQLKDGLEKPDVGLVEQHADLDRVAAGILDFAEATFEVAAEDRLGSFGAALTKATTSLARGVGGGQAKVGLKDDIRAAIAEGKAQELMKPFSPLDGFAVLSGVERLSDTVTQVRFNGTCEGGPVTVGVDFERTKDGPYGLPSWRLVGLNKAEAHRLAQGCYANAEARSK